MSASAEAAAHHQAMEDLHRDAIRIFTCLERHCPPGDLPTFRYLMGVPEKPRNIAQRVLEMDCAGDN